MTRQMAIDFGPLGIRVNAICPGHIVTEGLGKMWEASASRRNKRSAVPICQGNHTGRDSIDPGLSGVTVHRQIRD